MAKSSASYRICLPVWGAAYTEQFLRVALPSQMTPANLPWLASAASVTYELYTRAADAKTIRSSRAYERLVRSVQVRFHDIDEIMAQSGWAEQKYDTMNICHRHMVATSDDTNAGFVFLTPDSVWSDGSLRHMHQLAESGKRLVMITGLRVARETFVPALLSRFGVEPEVLNPIAGRELARLMFEHLHPEMLGRIWGCEFGSTWPSTLLWPVSDRGLACRAFHMHPLLVRPLDHRARPLFTMDLDYVLSACPDPSLVHVVRDSDDIIGVDLCAKNDHAPNPHIRPYSIDSVAGWARRFANERHRELVQHPVRFHYGTVQEAEWFSAEKRADEVITAVLERVAGRVELLRGRPSLTAVVRTKGIQPQLAEAISTLRAQSVPPTEIVVVDDSAEDRADPSVGAPDWLQGVRWIDSQARLQGQLNELLVQSSSEFVHVCDVSVRLLPEFFARSLRMLTAHDQAGMVCSDAVSSSDALGVHLSLKPLEWGFSPAFFKPDDLADLMHGDVPVVHTVVARRSVLVEAGGVDEELGHLRDWLWPLLVAFRSGCCYLPESLAFAVQRERTQVPIEEDLRRVLLRALAEIGNERHRAVLPRMVRANVTASLGPDVAKIVLSDSSLWDPKTLLLFQPQLWHWAWKSYVPSKDWRPERDVESTLSAAERDCSAGRLDHASARLNEFLMRAPHTARAYLALEKVELRRGDRAAALRALRQGIALLPNDVDLQRRAREVS